MPSQHPRCQQHGLVVATDGLCVLCRRDGKTGPIADTASYTPPLSAAEPAHSSLWKLGLVSGALLLTAAGLAAAVKLGGASAVAKPAAVVAKAPELSEPPELSPSEQSALDRAKAVDLAAALKRLEEAEVQRKAQEQLLAAQQEEQRKAAQAAQQKEQLERDKARHETVTRQLDEQAFRKRRGDVRITMYSTEWCGVCKKARAYMQRQHIPFNELDIERDDLARQKAHALNPRNSVPTITIDRELLIGFSPESLEDRISRAARAYKL